MNLVMQFATAGTVFALVVLICRGLWSGSR